MIVLCKCLSILLYVLFFFFFFSSRRRHTRLTCDWSSDVCSSDLPCRATRRCSSAWPTSSSPPCSRRPDRKSTRLNSSHMSISYAVFCLKKKKKSILYSKQLLKSHLHYASSVHLRQPDQA